MGTVAGAIGIGGLVDALGARSQLAFDLPLLGACDRAGLQGLPVRELPTFHPML